MFFLSIRYLKSRKKQTILTLLGIFFGAAAFVTISGFFAGFQGYLIEQLVNTNAHVHIQSREDFLYDHTLDNNFYKINKEDHVFWIVPPSGRKDSSRIEKPQDWYLRLSHDPSVIAFSPQLNTSALLTNAANSASATIIGCNPKQQSKVTNISDYMRVGSFDSLSLGGNRIIIGQELLNKIGAHVDQNITITNNKNVYPFKIVGVFSTGNKSTDSQAYANLEEVQKINNTPNLVNQIAVKLNNYNLAKQKAQDWSLLSNEKIESWDQQNASFLSIFKLQNMIRSLTISVILVVAAFGIYNVLTMTVSQKKKDIAILHSIGYESKSIVNIFLYQGLILGIVGGILGITLGYFICIYLQTVPFGADPFIGRMDHLHISITIDIYIKALIIAVMTSVIASILPAISAGRLTPIQIIREGAD